MLASKKKPDAQYMAFVVLFHFNQKIFAWYQKDIK